ncbi:MAG: ABC transporter ATP-binding protein [Thaumarchaeota archaeon]|nr:ABC transporter ATP-binding protein [Nitrososphaerota archaeon]
MTKSLQVSELSIEYSVPQGFVRAVDHLSFDLEEGEVLGIAGESGCGKTTAALSVLRILPRSAKVGGSIVFDDEEVLGMKEDRLRQYRWKDVSLVPQSAMNAFDPVLTIGAQIVEAIRLHEKMDKREAWKKAGDLLTSVGIERNRIRHYPHEFSGGMRQRAAIAMAIALNPKIVILDEPTTALDVVTQRQILNLLKNLQKQLRVSFIFITHDLSILNELSDRIIVMYAGRIAEIGKTERIFSSPSHPYTQALLSSMLPVYGPIPDAKPIGGLPPNLAFPPQGCRFHPRCRYAFERCSLEEPKLISIDEEVAASCHLLEKL